MELVAHTILAMALKERSAFEWLCQEICTIKLRINLLKLKKNLADVHHA
jgi:hypothetical protein